MINKENNYSEALNKKLLNFKLNKLNNDSAYLKQAYPNYYEQNFVSGQYNIEKWIDTLKEIYSNEHSGNTFKQAFDNSTKSWNEIEKNDFNNWIKFYQSGDHLKYKTAQDKNWYENEEMPGYFIPYTASASSENINKDIHSNIDFSNDGSVRAKLEANLEKEKQEKAAQEKASAIDAHRKKLISRLDSLERLLRSADDLSDEELNSLMETIFSLKKKIINLKKRSSVESFCKDLIIREANILAKNGSFKAASFLYVVADEKAQDKTTDVKPGDTKPAGTTPPASGPVSPPTSGAVSPTPPAPPTANVGSPSSTPTSTGLAAGSPPASPAAPRAPTGQPPVAPPSSGLPTSNKNEPLVEIESGLKDMGITDINLSDDLFVFDDANNIDDSFMVSTAQAADLNASTKETKPAAPAITEKHFDDQLEALLGKVSIEDVVLKIEEICKVFKTREIPRQLAIVDMMLDRLGLASFFPSLSEATNKSLESNNYILSRVENILSQLRGALKVREIDLSHENTVSPGAVEIRKNLEEREKAEAERKQMRKELEEKALSERAKEKEAPELEVTEEELAPTEAPVPTPAPAPAPIPAKPPATPPV